MKNSKICGRFAPTPSGRIHLGNIFCSLLAWLHAKSQGGEIVLRIEDLDKVRCPRPNADLLAKDLEWLGLTWDKGAYVSEDSERYFQSQRFDIYAEHFRKLEEQGLIYPCFCSRGQLHAAEAPHLSDGRILYAGTCKNLTASEREERAKLRQPAYRLAVNDEPISFIDGNYGKQSYNLIEESGDFIVRRSDGVYAYQLAVTVDDGLMNVTHVVRGADLLSSTPIQIYIYKLLGFTPPEFLHIPLLMAPDGRRLAKRDKDLDLSM
ncbi:MAG: tRNA glutamyl-Q(34) synthetase GluQRS, partial [Phascolarctobacterium sp.]|nr:tRNA glutamyl-Q(34) synthetase GluQRS [Phascolarctobacterium sp.]